MNHIVVGIPTYKRPSMLKTLIHSIYACSLNKDYINKIDIVIVDNDRDKTAEKIISQLETQNPKHFKLHYYSYPTKGLSHVRNEILKKSLALKPDYIAFVDDDEYVSPEWLNELLITLLKMNADIVQGPNKPIFENKISKGLEHWFDTVDYKNCTQVNFIETNNLLITAEFLLKTNLSFDLRFDVSGGEDTFLGVQALKKNAKIFWAKDAIVYETIPRKRANLKWLLLRKYRGATTYTYILKLEKKYFALLKKIVVSSCYLPLGLISLILVPFPINMRFWGLIKISEGIGGFAGMANITYEEYAKSL